MFPPIISTSCLLIARPRPEPPCLRVVDPSAWANSSKMWDCAAALMPAPVSLTSKRSVTFCAVSSRPATRITTEPCSVNLIALPRSEEHTSELQSRLHLVCRLLLEKKKDLDDISLVRCTMEFGGR